MTIVTKPLSEKKNENDKYQDPLMLHEVERGVSTPAFRPRSSSTRDLVRERRATSASTACLFLTALLVMSCGIVTGFYLYCHFVRAQFHKLHGWCKVPYEDTRSEDLAMLKLFSGQQIRRLEGNDPTFFDEEFEIDETYEKISVPDFVGGRASKFVHDFSTNKTGIVDVNGKRCFVKPLNRSEVLPPNSMVDLLKKMEQGYYEINTGLIRETMEVITPPIEDRSSLGKFIQRECADYPIYRLEKFVSGVYKRSADPAVVFTQFAGVGARELKIANYAVLEELEARAPVAMS